MSDRKQSKFPNKCAVALAERGGALRLACWRMGIGSDELTEPIAEGPRGQWLRAAALRERITSLNKAWLEQDAPEPVELEPGCWLVPALCRRNRKVSGVATGMTFDSAVFDRPWFEAICREAGTTVDEAREGLSPYTWPGKIDLPLLTGAFRSAVKDLSQAQADRGVMDSFSEQLLNTYEETNLLFRLARLMNSLDDPAELVPTCCHQMLPIFPFKWIAVKFWERKNQVQGMTGVLVVAGDLRCDEGKFERVVIDQFAGNKHGDWTRLLLPGSGGVADLLDSEVIAETITHDGEVVGVLLAGNKQGACPMESDVTSGELQFIEAASNLMGVFHENISRFNEQRQLFMGTLHALTASIDAKDPYTRGHSERVAYMAARLAEAVGMDATYVELIHTTGLVHDVGKIGVPEAVLCKPGRLTKEEFDQIKQHPAIGYHILKGIPAIDPMLPGVLHHHERWDGKGYPHGLAGKDIPEMGRLLALADTFDAMSSTRSYRPAMPREVVLEEIRNCAGTQFDPELAPVFVELDFTAYDRLVEKHRSLSVFAA
jgi:HD-GYP domain-containing protein (c-di-GMP phosphodiesterase class II)